MTEKLRIAIFADLEGISGVNTAQQCESGSEEYHATGQLYYTEDVNAVIRGIRKSAAEAEIGIIYFHDSGHEHLLLDKLEPNVNVLGDFFSPKYREFMYQGKVDAAILIGFHAMAGTEQGFLAHTLTGGIKVSINDVSIGEPHFLAVLLSETGVPAIMVTGDQYTIEQSSSYIPGIRTVQVKSSSGSFSTDCFPLNEVRAQIEETSSRAIAELSQFKPLKVEKPLTLNVTFAKKEIADIVTTYTSLERISDVKVSFGALNSIAEGMELWQKAMYLNYYGRAIHVMEKLEEIPEVKKLIDQFSNELIGWKY